MTGIICAMQIEADGIIALSQNTQTEEIAGMKFTTGTLNGRDIAVVVCGVGKVNAAMCAVVLIEKFNPDVVINSGVGGSLSPLVSIGDIVVATKSVQHDMNTTALGDKRGEVSFPDGTKIFFDCDKTVVEKLTQACKTLPDTKVSRALSQAATYSFQTVKSARELPTHSALSSVKWRVRQSVMFATHSKLLTESSGQSPMTLMKTRVLIMQNSASLQAKKP